MKLKNFLIVTENLKKSIAFYEELFNLKIVDDNDGNVVMTDGLCLQDRKIWESSIGNSVYYKNHATELYFEENDIDGFQKKLEQCSFDIEYVNRLMTNSWGQQFIRIYDPDHHIIEIEESMDFVQKREKKRKRTESVIDEKRAKEELEKGYSEAEEMLADKDKLERFIQRLEKKLKSVPVVGDKLADIAIMVSLVKSYIKKEYTDIPIGSIIAILSALIYFVSPIDIVPDSIPILGYIDDAAVIAVCWKFVESDIEEYNKWREENNKIIDI